MTATASKIRRNADGLRNLADLRKALAADSNVDVYQQGGAWIISRWSESMRLWVESPCHMLDDQRTAIEKALGIN